MDCVDIEDLCMIIDEDSYNSGYGSGYVDVDCPAGYVVMGGGWSDYMHTVNIEHSYPSDTDKWSCDYSDKPESECYAICCDDDFFETEIIEEDGTLSSGITADCSSGYEIVGGGFYDEWDKVVGALTSDQDDSRPIGSDQWYCSDDESDETDSECYAVCAQAISPEADLDCITVSETINLFSAGYYYGEATVNCPSGYVIMGGGFQDPSISNDDQDWSNPEGNSWYCREDFTDYDPFDGPYEGTCYARCCRFD